MKLSILLVARNEERYISSCIRSIAEQLEPDISKKEVEFILVDGCSSDKTVELALNEFNNLGFQYKVINNPLLTLSPGWNIAITHAEGEFLLRPDVHSVLLPGYIKIGLGVLHSDKRISAIGGVLKTEGKTFVGRLNALALSTRIGVGNSPFRIGAKSGFYETCVYGIYRKVVFDQVGLFDLNLVRHEDNDMHARIIKNGGVLYMDSRMMAVYYCRDSYYSLATQMFRNGYHMFSLSLRKVSIMSARHFAPFFLMIYFLLFSAYAGFWGFVIAFVVYVGALLSVAFVMSLASKVNYFFCIPSFFVCHVCYGLGQIVGLFSKFYVLLKKGIIR